MTELVWEGTDFHKGCFPKIWFDIDPMCRE